MNQNFIISGGVLVKYRGSETNVILPEGIIAIGENAFQNNIAVASVTFSNSVVMVRKNAFEGCVNLSKLENYSQITHYEKECFKNTGLREVTIGPKVQFLGEYCFSHNQYLGTVVYKPNKTIAVNNTFAFCSNLTELEMDDNYFFPSYFRRIYVTNNPQDKRPTYGDLFFGTPFIKTLKEELIDAIKLGVCFDCGGRIKKGLFHARCTQCKIDYKNKGQVV